MCGICGYIGDGAPETLKAMAAALAHRGPDDYGLFEADGVGLAHRRLSIIDLEGGHQPMVSPTGDVLVFNGEIYNFREVRRDLEEEGCRFLTHSDTEVILAAWQHWGESCLERLRGMFAFALWDSRTRSLFLARDRVGIKPLYYAEVDGVFYFASEIGALLEAPGFQRRLNPRALPLYLSFRYTPGEETLFEGVKKLLPGHSMTLAAKASPVVRRWWSFEFAPEEGRSEADWQEAFWETFQEAVRLHMVSDVPLGAYLSGGLDSSLMVAAMREIFDGPLDTFSVGFRDRRFNELPFAEEVATRFGCRHHVLHAEEEAGALLPQVIRRLGEPLGDLAAIPTFQMARETKPHLNVVLSGEGADELLAGYPKYRAFLTGRHLRRMVPGIVSGLLSRGMSNLSLQRALASVAKTERPDAYLALASVFTGEEMANLLLPEHRELARSDAAEAFVRPFFAPGRDGLSQLLALDFHTWLPDDLLLKNDRMTMAHGIEARVPYLDHKLVELCARVPSRYKLGWFREKLLLRRVIADRLPARIRRRRKSGFTVPLAAWYRTEFGRRVDEVLSPEFLRRQGLFRPEAIAALRQRPLDHPYYRRQFWSVAALNLWQAEFEVETAP